MPVSAFLRAFTSPPAWSTQSATAVAKAMDDSEREGWVNLAASAWTLIDGTEETE